MFGSRSSPSADPSEVELESMSPSDAQSPSAASSSPWLPQQSRPLGLSATRLERRNSTTQRDDYGFQAAAGAAERTTPGKGRADSGGGDDWVQVEAPSAASRPATLLQGLSSSFRASPTKAREGGL